jgi:coenzyme F420-dependent glucose-6-phosphate dehydrogenase
MVEIGYALSCDAYAPNDVIRYMQLAEEAGFAFALLADHNQPWVEQQGQSPFIWSVIGGIAHATQRLRLVMAMACPTPPMHPSTIAQAVATAAAMMPGRCCLSLEAGESLSERIWERNGRVSQERLERLEEAAQVIRLLWRGGLQSHWGRYYGIENTQVYSPPEERPAVFISAREWYSAVVAGRIGDGLISAMPKRQLIQAFEAAGGKGKPRYGKLHVCWDRDKEEARRMPQSLPSAVLGKAISTVTLPKYYFPALMGGCEAHGPQLLCGADPARHIAAIEECARAGYERVYIHSVGPDQEGFIRFYQQRVLPALLSGR